MPGVQTPAAARTARHHGPQSAGLLQAVPSGKYCEYRVEPEPESLSRLTSVETDAGWSALFAFQEDFYGKQTDAALPLSGLPAIDQPGLLPGAQAPEDPAGKRPVALALQPAPVAGGSATQSAAAGALVPPMRQRGAPGPGHGGGPYPAPSGGLGAVHGPGQFAKPVQKLP